MNQLFRRQFGNVLAFAPFLISISVFDHPTAALAACEQSNKYYEQCQLAVQCYDACLTWRKTDPHGCDRKIIQWYSNFMASTLNTYLRGVENFSGCDRASKLLGDAINRLPPTGELMVFRGIRNANPLKNLKPGDCFADPAFVSTSIDEKIAKMYSQNGAFLEMIGFDGKSISENSLISGEKEILFQPNRYFKILKIFQKYGVPAYQLQEVEYRQACPNLNH